MDEDAAPPGARFIVDKINVTLRADFVLACLRGNTAEIASGNDNDGIGQIPFDRTGEDEFVSREACCPSQLKHLS